MQVGDAELLEIVEMTAYAVQSPGESVGVADVADHPRPLEPTGIDLASTIEHPQPLGSLPGGLNDELDAGADHSVEIGRVAVQQLERFDDVEVMHLEARRQSIGLEGAELRREPIAHGREQAVEDAHGALSAPPAGSGDGIGHIGGILGRRRLRYFRAMADLDAPGFCPGSTSTSGCGAPRAPRSSRRCSPPTRSTCRHRWSRRTSGSRPSRRGGTGRATGPTRSSR